MAEIAQGTIIRLERPSTYALILSREFFNRSGLAVVCPVVKSAAPDALHIEISSEAFTGTALLEQLRSLDLASRHYKELGTIPYRQLQDISDAVQDIFSYYPYSVLS